MREIDIEVNELDHIRSDSDSDSDTRNDSDNNDSDFMAFGIWTHFISNLIKINYIHT